MAEEAEKPRKRRWARILRNILIVIAAVLMAGALDIHIYASDYYRATDEALAAEQPSSQVAVTSYGNGDVTFLPAGGKVTAALVFYPGGKVQADAYAPLLSRLADRGIACVLVKMPENLAVLSPGRASRGRAELEGDLSAAGVDAGSIPWMIGGHSLGGAMAASYVARHADSYKGLVLLAAYSTADLTKSGLSVLTMYGSEDGVVNRDSLAQDAANLPEDDREPQVIQGGIHSYFGCYGIQDGDGTPSITNDEQLDEAAGSIADFAAGLPAAA